MLTERFSGLGLSSTSLPNNSKTQYNHLAIQVSVTTLKEKSFFEFLVLVKALCFITNSTVRSNEQKKPLLQKKKAMLKNIVVIMTSQK